MNAYEILIGKKKKDDNAYNNINESSKPKIKNKTNVNINIKPKNKKLKLISALLPNQSSNNNKQQPTQPPQQIVNNQQPEQIVNNQPQEQPINNQQPFENKPSIYQSYIGGEIHDNRNNNNQINDNNESQINYNNDDDAKSEYKSMIGDSSDMISNAYNKKDAKYFFDFISRIINEKKLLIEKYENYFKENNLKDKDNLKLLDEKIEYEKKNINYAYQIQQKLKNIVREYQNLDEIKSKIIKQDLEIDDYKTQIEKLTNKGSSYEFKLMINNL